MFLRAFAPSKPVYVGCISCVLYVRSEHSGADGVVLDGAHAL